MRRIKRRVRGAIGRHGKGRSVAVSGPRGGAHASMRAHNRHRPRLRRDRAPDGQPRWQTMMSAPARAIASALASRTRTAVFAVEPAARCVSSRLVRSPCGFPRFARNIRSSGRPAKFLHARNPSRRPTQEILAQEDGSVRSRPLARRVTQPQPFRAMSSRYRSRAVGERPAVTAPRHPVAAECRCDQVDAAPPRTVADQTVPAPPRGFARALDRELNPRRECERARARC